MWEEAAEVYDQRREEEASDYLEPFGKDFPGPASWPREEPTQTLDSALRRLGYGVWHIGLVGVARPADLIVAIGWDGAVNYDLEAAAIASILRSWEDRFAAYLVAVDGQRLSIAVGNPPVSIEHAAILAAEHYALAPDLIEQGEGSIAAYARTILDAPLWTPWWD